MFVDLEIISIGIYRRTRPYADVPLDTTTAGFRWMVFGDFNTYAIFASPENSEGIFSGACRNFGVGASGSCRKIPSSMTVSSRFSTVGLNREIVASSC